jgi:hypothetical protein
MPPPRPLDGVSMTALMTGFVGWEYRVAVYAVTPTSPVKEVPVATSSISSKMALGAARAVVDQLLHTRRSRRGLDLNLNLALSALAATANCLLLSMM